MPPSSGQNPVGNSKAAKFAASNPLAPLADPFSGTGDDDGADLQREVSRNVQDRLERAMEELKEKHRTGTNEVDDADRAPTGAAYREVYRERARREREEAAARGEAEERDRLAKNRGIVEAREQLRRMKFTEEKKDSDGRGDDDGSSGDEFDYLLEEDGELEAIRQARIAQLKLEQSQRAEHLSLGHGSLRTIREDEFLGECTGSSRHVAVHFYHDDFKKCEIMDFHLRIVARDHLEAKFLRIDAARAPFFVVKLRVRTLPALVVFEDGKEIGRLTGFEGLATDPKRPDEWHTGRLREWMAGTGAIRYERPTEEVEEERRRLGIVARGAVYGEAERGEGDFDDF